MNLSFIHRNTPIRPKTAMIEVFSSDESTRAFSSSALLRTVRVNAPNLDDSAACVAFYENVTRFVRMLVSEGAENVIVDLSGATDAFSFIKPIVSDLEKLDLPNANAEIRLCGEVRELESLDYVIGIDNCAFEDHKSDLERYNREQPSSPSFVEMIHRFLAEKNMTAPQLYDSIAISRDYFSKVASFGKKRFRPKKARVELLAIGLHLNLEETEELLNSIGFHLTDNMIEDRILRYYIERGIYDLVEIYSAMEHYKCKSWMNLFDKASDSKED